MICPVCKTDMIVVEYNDIELDYCSDCRGVWFDAGELGLLLKAGETGEIGEFLYGMQQTENAKTNEQKRRCPICTSKMDKKDIGEEPKILIDVCGKGHGLWFDGGEVTQLVGQLEKGETGIGSDNPAVGFLKEFFGPTR